MWISKVSNRYSEDTQWGRYWLNSRTRSPILSTQDSSHSMLSVHCFLIVTSVTLNLFKRGLWRSTVKKILGGFEATGSEIFYPHWRAHLCGNALCKVTPWNSKDAQSRLKWCKMTHCLEMFCKVFSKWSRLHLGEILVQQHSRLASHSNGEAAAIPSCEKQLCKRYIPCIPASLQLFGFSFNPM